MWSLGNALTALGRGKEALERLQVLWEYPQISEFVWTRLATREAMAEAAFAISDLKRARIYLTELRDDATAARNPLLLGHADRLLGWIDRVEGDHNLAETRLHHALDLAHDLGCRQDVAATLEAIGGLEVDHERHAVAAALYGAASSIRAEAGVVIRRPRYEADLATTVAVLGDEFQRAWASGTAMTLDDAVNLARRGRGERGRPTLGWDSLTPTEWQVATQAANGLTNQQIADELIMGRETVKTHISSVLRKLDLTNRTQLATAVHQHDHAPQFRRKTRPPTTPNPHTP
jgi:DNA-binding CsgD family transcriptional regulator